ncbi:hypothetical protein [Paraburkholderia sp. Cpub6]|uniref:hypothetical protein n=1 Tax=Paraburkholderia sp. Cpub6 TaxID=2723094 RepID=UPI00160C47E6|nr:hypothetical protein [Paraburkholderia sp. Cpub6]MBB5460647.1 hypothetical protein [Paraburkholderia sp. Cpub6]
MRCPTEAIRNVDFIVEELHRREPEDPSRIGATRVALQNQRNNLLAFAGVLDQKLGAMDRASGVSDHLVRATCLLHRKPDTSVTFWQAWTGCTPPSATSSTISTRPCRRLDDEDSADCQREIRIGPINTDPDADGECKHERDTTCYGMTALFEITQTPALRCLLEVTCSPRPSVGNLGDRAD